MSGEGGFWNYRVVRVPNTDGTFGFEIRECYYDGPQRAEKNPIPNSVTANAVTVFSDSAAGVGDVLEMMRRACELPALDAETLQPLQDSHDVKRR